MYTIDVTNLSRYALNGVQAVLTLPSDVEYTGDLSEDVTLQGQNNVIVTIGHLAAGESRPLAVETAIGEDLSGGAQLTASRSSSGSRRFERIFERPDGTTTFACNRGVLKSGCSVDLPS